MKTGVLRNNIYVKLIKNKDNFIFSKGNDFGRFLARLSGAKVEVGDIVDTENCIYYKIAWSVIYPTLPNYLSIVGAAIILKKLPVIHALIHCKLNAKQHYKYIACIKRLLIPFQAVGFTLTPNWPLFKTSQNY